MFDRPLVTGRPHEATCANGAWLVVLPDSVGGEPPLVRFLDPAGDLAVARIDDRTATIAGDGAVEDLALSTLDPSEL